MSPRCIVQEGEPPGKNHASGRVFGSAIEPGTPGSMKKDHATSRRRPAGLQVTLKLALDMGHSRDTGVLDIAEVACNLQRPGLGRLCGDTATLVGSSIKNS